MNDVTHSFSYVTINSILASTFVSCKNSFTVNFLKSNSNINIMGNLLYVIAVILVIGWAIGFVGYNTGGIIHILLVIAVIAVILRLIQGRKIL